MVLNENQAQPSVDLHRDKQAIMSADVSYCKIRPYRKDIIPQNIELEPEWDYWYSQGIIQEIHNENIQ